MKRNIKKLFLTSTILLLGFTSCGSNYGTMRQLNNDVYAASDADYPTYGEKSDTANVITMKHNQEGGGIYAIAYIESGTTFKQFCDSIGKRLTITVQGYTKNNSANYGWYHDEWGVNPFDANAPITESMTLWSYLIPKTTAPAIQEIPSLGQYTLTWKNGAGSSYVGVNDTLPYVVNLGETIEFKLAYSYFAEGSATVKVDNSTLTPNSEGIYSFTVSGNHTITASDVKDKEETVDEFAYYISINGENTKLVKNTGNVNEYMITGVALQKGDKVTIVDSDGNSYNTIKNSGLGDFTTWEAPYAGSYDFYFDYVNSYTFVAIPADPEAGIIDVYFHNTKGWSNVYYYTWGSSGSLATWPGTKIDGEVASGYYKVSIDLSKYTSIIFNNGNGTQTADLSLVGCKSGVMFDANGNKSTYSA